MIKQAIESLENHYNSQGMPKTASLMKHLPMAGAAAGALGLGAYGLYKGLYPSSMTDRFSDAIGQSGLSGLGTNFSQMNADLMGFAQQNPEAMSALATIAKGNQQAPTVHPAPMEEPSMQLPQNIMEDPYLQSLQNNMYSL